MTVKRHKHRRYTIDGVLQPYLPVATQRKGKPNRRVVAAGYVKAESREYYLHSTKGYRSARV